MKKKILFLLVTVTAMFFGCTGFSVESTSEETSQINDSTDFTDKSIVEEISQINYAYTTDDVINLKNLILNMPTEENPESKPYDMNSDDIYDVFDFCIMKHELLNPIENENDTLVVYFSRTGNTEKIADYLIELTNADSYAIEAAVPYTDDDIEYTNSSCRANQEQNDKTVRPEIANLIESIDSYDTIFLGYPIWWGEEPRIIDTFLESYDFSDKIVIPFCTSASSGNAASERNIKNLGVNYGELLSGRRFSQNSTKNEVSEWLETLKHEWLKTNNIKPADDKIYLTINGKQITATLEDNSSTKALKEKLAEKDITVYAKEYGGFEKVGKLGFSLPKNDMQYSTESGDIMLYQGNQITLFYNSNSWSYTKLAHVDNMTQDELKSLLGDDDVTIIISAD